MNGLEAIELMKQGKMVSAEMKDDEVIITKIENNKVYWLFDYELEDNEWKEEDCFDFTLDYEEYKPKSLTGWERTPLSEEYITIGTRTRVYYKEVFDSMNQEHFKTANYFSTKEKAEEIDFKQTLFRKLQRFSDENGGNEIDWKDKPQNKYAVFYSHVNRNFIVTSCWQSQNFGQVHFISEEVANKAIELFHDDLIKYFTM